MLRRDEIIRSLDGAWRLFLDRPEAMRYFDISLDGFWRSFGAVILVFPAYLLTALMEQQVILTDSIADDAFSGSAFWTNKIAVLGLDWVTLPIILALVAGPLGIGRHYASFIVVRNWCSVLGVAPFGVIAFLFMIGLINIDIANFLSLAALIVVLRYNYLIARRALNVGLGFAIGIVVLDLAISLAIAAFVGSLFAS